MFRYTVRCEFTTPNIELVERWLAWLRGEHIRDVLDAGAHSAEIVQMDAASPTYEIRYSFNSREQFATYESEHAARLRDEGLRRFPSEQGLTYTRTTGEVVFALS